MPALKKPLKIARFYSFALIILAMTLIADHLLMQPIITLQKDNAEIINISGKQRMLSQRLSLLTLQIAHGKKQALLRKELKKVSDLMLENHNFLTRHTVHSHNIVQKEHAHIQSKRMLSKTIHDLYYEKVHTHGGQNVSLDDLVRNYNAKITQLLNTTDIEVSINSPLVLHITQDYPHLILPLLDNVVKQYEKESNLEVTELSHYDLLFLIFKLSILFAIGLFIFRPMEMMVSKYAAELEYANEQIEKTSQNKRLAALGELSGGIAHEINNALQPIIGLSDILLKRLEKLSDPQSIEYMKIIADSGDHAQKIMANILAFARNHNTDFELHTAYKVAEETAKLAKATLPDGITLQTFGIDDLKTHDDLYINCNLTSLSQITRNVMKNASDSMKNEGNITLDIQIADLSKEFITENGLHGDQFISFKVKDEGCGISKDALDKIFNPFYTTKDEGEGTGLGLSVSYGIVQSHQGTMIVESTLGVGSEFQIILPLIDKNLYERLQAQGIA